MSDVVAKANHLRDRCKDVMLALEQTDGAPRPNGGTFDKLTSTRSPAGSGPSTPCPTLHGCGCARTGWCRRPRSTSTATGRRPRATRAGWPTSTPSLAVIDTIKDNLAGWEGLAARNFRTNYAEKFEGYTRNLYTATYVGYQSVAAVAKAVGDRGQGRQQRLLDDATKAVDAIIGISLGTSLEIVLTLLPSVISIGTAKAGETGLTVIKEARGSRQDGRADEPEDPDAGPGRPAAQDGRRQGSRRT
ncbi:hypothetical protein G5V59_11435 [Nocardioides sp. W3-2-3]|uniref:hypothetical protein n=1 Tax=Nocardioides convexus TaxID=2712224 RepID=UPI00241894B4|nr:hypothetical protein [Nocardioides convexus]NHA00458.1 hypothetical protein [Nocardioides convexus]